LYHFQTFQCGALRAIVADDFPQNTTADEMSLLLREHRSSRPVTSNQLGTPGGEEEFSEGSKFYIDSTI